MSIQEEITALLNGELVDEGRVAELMHVLAVSPEKRQLMVEQIRMSRGYNALGSAIAPPAAADARIWQGLHDIDAGIAPVAIATTAATGGVSMLGRVGLMSMLATLLLGVGIGAGYLFGFDFAMGTPEYARQAPDSDPTFMLLATAQDSLDAGRQHLQELGASYDRALARVGDLQQKDSARSSLVARQAARIRELEGRVAALSSRPAVVERRVVLEGTALQPPPPGEITLRIEHEATPGRERPEIVVPPAELPAEPVKTDGKFQAGFRRNLRLSLPRVYGLSTPTDILRDNEFVASMRVAGEAGTPGSMRVGVAAGETQFAQIFHTNRDTIGIDRTVRQSPALLYGRAYIAPRLVTIEGVNVSLEMGGGGTAIGPMGTAGLTMEWGTGSVTVASGVSGWMLWSGLDEEIYTSTNLNAFLGFGVAF